ncbi:MAG: O-succinylbenzoic acid--CoA ligase [Alteromonas sp.]|nr:O-succinylbenzoic acid--CoA ligase [Alteromonas sp.]MAY22944.1 O-succinylbenzoic acid--CoA ligase [Flavobacteriaceae bacterium]
MKPTSPYIHPKFQLNGLSFSNAEELLNFADGLQQEGDDFEVSMANFLEEWLNFKEYITVQTSGSTGTPKTIQLKKEQMIQSAIATGGYFKVGEGTKALLCLSSDYIAGKMMLVRGMVLGWDLHVVAPEKDALVEYDNPYDFVALVPYQLYHSIEALDKVKKIIIGGGEVSEELEGMLQELPVEAFATYGMTETITHVAARRINGFARSEVYYALPNVKFRTDDRGCLVIQAPKISDVEVVTNDLVELISPISFKWLGRYDFVINSGGVKLNPETIERKLRSKISCPFIIASEEDPALGQKVILVVEDTSETPSDYAEIFTVLEPYERPKKVYTLSKFPYTETGKIKRSQISEVLRRYRK